MKHWKILIAAPLVAFAVNFSFAGAVNSGVPKGWTANGALTSHYESGLDASQGSKEQPAFFMAAKEAVTNDDFAAITQLVDATAYRGKIMHFTASARHMGELGGYEFWIRTIDDKGGISISSSWARKSDNWEAVRVRLLVPANATKLELGIGLRDKGKLLVKSITFNEAQANNPATENKPSVANKITMGPAATTIQNLNFSE
ncbi:hypothetical protein [Undibacterium pigrum]|uniref:Uncharacterized protein n=1 Tax=Undibacterium pigrum TaxID=401470 RepID=A0A318IRM1_9BURK|nr:hypothetical protein [Undibacterium pigrum]PXX35324.1 hypothetical protein DFR42_12011 [Undibacterium pigrum]